MSECFLPERGVKARVFRGERRTRRVCQVNVAPCARNFAMGLSNIPRLRTSDRPVFRKVWIAHGTAGDDANLVGLRTRRQKWFRCPRGLSNGERQEGRSRYDDLIDAFHIPVFCFVFIAVSSFSLVAVWWRTIRGVLKVMSMVIAFPDIAVEIKEQVHRHRRDHEKDDADKHQPLFPSLTP